jgi:hypothetical protein
MEAGPNQTDTGLEPDPARAHRMALAEAPEREAILRAKEKAAKCGFSADIIQLNKEILRRENWAEEASTQAGKNYDHDTSSGDHLVEMPHAEIMAYAAKSAMERYRRGKKLRRAADIIIDNVITSGGFQGMPGTTAYLHHMVGRYFRRRTNKNLKQADKNAEAAQEHLVE